MFSPLDRTIYLQLLQSKHLSLQYESTAHDIRIVAALAGRLCQCWIVDNTEYLN